MNKQTSWGGVADWYDDLLENSADSYQKNVILPNLTRLIEAKPDNTILDLACGQGYFSFAFAQSGAKIIGCDISKELIAHAKDRLVKEKNSNIEFHVTPSDKLGFIQDGTVDVITIVLAIQNIENIAGTFAECSRVLKPNGKLFVVLNHPSFRIPQRSSWQWDEKDNKQYRRIDCYMSEQSFEIDMTPGEKDTSKKKFTVSFHRPLQQYVKALAKSGFSIHRLEEWISHKKSQDGPRSDEEDRTRKEIPMFMCLECGR